MALREDEQARPLTVKRFTICDFISTDINRRHLFMKAVAEKAAKETSICLKTIWF
jgi:hypothetical protein